MPILLDELNGVGVPDDNMFVIFAAGAHRELSEKEMTELVGPEVARRVKMYNSNAYDPDQFQYVGTTSRGNKVSFHKRVVEADHIVCTGSIVHHYFAGFGGGRKAMLPGVASYETICRNHALMLEPGAEIGKLKGNPVYEDQIEGVEFHRPSFLLNVVLNEKKEFLKVFAGDYIQAHFAVCEFVDQVYGTPIAQTGRPGDCHLRRVSQGHQRVSAAKDHGQRLGRGAGGRSRHHPRRMRRRGRVRPIPAVDGGIPDAGKNRRENPLRLRRRGAQGLRRNPLDEKGAVYPGFRP